jgi:Tol biopolymer transport system component
MTTTLCELLDRGVVVQAHEAVAIVQQLINDAGCVGVSASPGPPSVVNIQLRGDGTAFTAGCDATPSVVEAAIILQTMLPAGAGQVPGGLRYAIVRSLRQVDAPPFGSVVELSRVLERFERGDRRASVRTLLERAQAQRRRPEAPVEAAVRAPVRESVVVPPPPAVREVAPVHAVQEAVPIAPTAFDELPLRHAPPVELFAAYPPPAIESGGYGRLWVVAAVLVGAVALGGLADVNQNQVGAFRQRLQTQLRRAAEIVVSRVAEIAVPQTVPGTVSGTVPQTVPGTVSGTMPHAVPGTVSGTVPQTVPGTVSGTVPRTIPDTVGTAGSVPATITGAEDIDYADTEVVSAVDAQQRPIFSPAFESNSAAMFFPTVTNDEQGALAVVRSPGEDGSDLRVMTILDDDGARNYHVQPSPDGRRVAFDSDRDGERGIYIASRDGSDVRRVSGPGYAAMPAWSPDGRRIAYIRAEPDHPKVWNLWLQSVDSDHATQLTHYRSGQPWSASWFPDNRRVCYTYEDKIVLMDLETRRIWTFNSPIAGRLVRTPAVSPDGTKVIFEVARDGAWMLDLSDRSMRRVLSDPTAEEFAWSPDGRRVAFHSRRDGQWSVYILHQD